MVYTRWRAWFHGTLFLLLLLHSGHAQQPAERPFALPATGSVVGSISDDASRTPLRFAEIKLIPVPENLVSAPAQREREAAARAAGKAPPLQSVTGSSTLEGTIRMDGVPAGDYLVCATKPGYITDASSADLDVPLDQLKKIMASLPFVHVVPGTASTVRLTMHPGGVLAGRIQYADGSPAVGIGIATEKLGRASSPGYLAETATPLWQALSSFLYIRDTRREIFADDEGRFRIFGLPPGKYVVSTNIGIDPNPSARLNSLNGESYRVSGREHLYPEIITIYASSAFQKADARVFEIKGQETILDADLKIDIARLHTLQGRVLTAGDRHAPAGMVQLQQKGSATPERLVELEDDGSFAFHDLPSGSYELKVIASEMPSDVPQPPVRYTVKMVSAILLDQDLALDEIVVNPLKPGEAWIP